MDEENKYVLEYDWSNRVGNRKEIETKTRSTLICLFTLFIVVYAVSSKCSYLQYWNKKGVKIG